MSKKPAVADRQRPSPVMRVAEAARERLCALEYDGYLVAMRVLVGLLFVYFGMHAVLDEKLGRRIVQAHVTLPVSYVPLWLVNLVPRNLGVLVVVHYGISALGAAVVLGLYTPVTIGLALTAQAMLFLSNEPFFLNHIYAQLLFSLLVLFMDSGRSRSLDAVLDGRSFTAPGRVPAWMRWSMQLLFHSMYLYAAVAKLHFDWLRGQPVAEWFTHDALVTRLFRWSDGAGIWAAESPSLTAFYGCWFVPYLIALGGIGWDAAAPFLGCAGASGSRLRRVLLTTSIVGTVAFNGLNHLHMGIGIFPPMVVALTAVLYWWRPQRAVNLGDEEGALADDRPPRNRAVTTSFTWRFFAVAAIMTVVLLLPLRPYVLPGNTQHDASSLNFSWWMKREAVRFESDCIVDLFDPRTGEAILPKPYVFQVTKTRMFDPSPLGRGGMAETFQPLLTDKAFRKVLDRPHLLPRVARAIRDRFETYACPALLDQRCEAAVHFEVWRSKNHRRHERLVRIERDLAADELQGVWSHHWLEPPAPVEGWHRFQTLPALLGHAWRAAFGGEEAYDDSPCWPWNGAHRRRDYAGIYECTLWWYKPDGGRDQLMAGGGDSWLEKLFHPWQGFNDAEPCEKALGWWLDDKEHVEALCGPPIPPTCPAA